MLSAVTSLLLAVAIFLCPAFAVIALALGARSLSRRGAPRMAVSVAYLFATLVGLLVFAAYVGGVLVAMGPVSGERVDPSQKARALAEGISEAMNCGAFALLIALLAAGWIGFWRWRRR